MAASRSDGLSTNVLVYGSHVIATPPFGLLLGTALLPLTLCCPLHTCVAVLAAAGGGLLRNDDVSLDDDEVLSFGFARSVLSIPPAFLSGLGVLPRDCDEFGVAKLGDVLDWRLIVRGASLSELGLLTYDGRLGTRGLRSGVGGGRGMSA